MVKANQKMDFCLAKLSTQEIYVYYVYMWSVLNYLQKRLNK